MKLFYLIIASLFLVCCQTKGRDALMWLNRYPIEKSGNIMSEQLPFFEINKKYRNVYIKKLNDEKYIILNADDYYSLTGQILRKKYGLAIRAIGSHPDGEFRVYKNFINELDVIPYMPPTNDFSYYKKMVLIIEVDEIPTDIYNSLPTENMVLQAPRRITQVHAQAGTLR